MKAGEQMEGFWRMFTIISLFSVLGFGLYWLKEYRNKAARLETIIEGLIDCNQEMKETLLAGLTDRYGHAVTHEEDTIPLNFERFVAKILRVYYGGKTAVTRINSDFGIGIEHRRGNQLHLGQAKCPGGECLIDYEPVAIIHSQMIKQGAAGGFIATTSGFTGRAKQYAEDLKIDLIDGSMLVELWSHSLAKQRERKKQPLSKEA